jgi:DNA-nicking Smr family endonuclease
MSVTKSINSNFRLEKSQKPSTSSSLSDLDKDVWKKYIDNLYSKPELDFRPKKGLDQTLKFKLDLHGMTVQQAFHTTKQFLEEHNINGSESVVIVVGKGGKISDEFPMWCENLGFIRRIDPIIDSTGGYGAYIVTLYKRR